VVYSDVCGASGLGRGISLTSDGTASGAVAWAPGTLDQALAGGLVAIFDADFLQGNSDASRALLANLLNYLVRISAASPGIATVTGPSAGSYKAGAVLAFTVEYDGAVSVTGAPKLPLTINSAAATASYAEGNGTLKLIFKYTVKKGDNGILACGTALDSTGGTLTDGDGFPAHALLNGITMGSVVLDTTAPSPPAITSITGTSITGTAEPSTTVNLYVGDTLVATAAADARGNWTCALPANLAGALTVYASDPAGNTSEPTGGMNVDTSVPFANPVAVTAPTTARPTPSP
jgi:hypothetical protein